MVQKVFEIAVSFLVFSISFSSFLLGIREAEVERRGL
jgi:hypothetical protein